MDLIERKAAIDEVKRLHDVAWANWKETRISANTMIDALKDLPSAQPEKRTETHACDCISRKTAIDAMGNAQWAKERLMELPSARPEIIRCKECKHHWTHRCMDSMPTEICELDQTFYDADVDFCSLAERRTDERSDFKSGGD